jgi:hypothetical protein
VLEKLLPGNKPYRDASRPSVKFDQLVLELEEFRRAKTKLAKQAWFTDRSISDTAFLQNISIPDGGIIRRIAAAVTRNRITPPTMGWRAPSVAADAKDLTKSIFGHLIRQEFLQLSKMADAESIAACYGLSKRISADKMTDLVTNLLKLFMVRDHGSVARFHDRRRMDDLISELPALLAKSPFASYDTLEQALMPVAGTDDRFIIAPFPPPAEPGTKFLVLARFVHAPSDTIALALERRGTTLVITSVEWVVEH